MNLKEFIPTTEVSEVVQLLMLSAMEMYDRNPTVASIGYLSLVCSIPLKILLNHFIAIKKEDNALVKERLRLSLESKKLNAQSQRPNLANGNGE
ncbi:hypothetical protein RN22_10910 [Grimontia sp. AD028]|nr:hypothetical protein RN22_10910 [Grimontia sp. AD028]